MAEEFSWQEMKDRAARQSVIEEKRRIKKEKDKIKDKDEPTPKKV